MMNKNNTNKLIVVIAFACAFGSMIMQASAPAAAAAGAGKGMSQGAKASREAEGKPSSIYTKYLGYAHFKESGVPLKLQGSFMQLAILNNNLQDLEMVPG